MMTLFPVTCGGCNAALSMRSQYLLCELCLPTILENPTPEFTRLPSGTLCYAPYLYGGALETMLWRAKFRGREDLALALGRLLADHKPAKRLAAQYEILMPLPLSFRRQFHRGYNQSDHIAQGLATNLKLPLRTNWQRRHTEPQHKLGRQDRKTNIQGAFKRVKGVENKTILVIDDVVTTGFTLDEAARTLLESGARKVHALALTQANWSYLKT